MTSHQINLVKESWSLVAHLGVAAGKLFYSQLFEIAPQAYSLFKSDIGGQSKKLAGMISFIVLKLDHFDELVPEVKKLAARHVNYGVEFHHYAWVGEALLTTLEKALADKWNSELKEAWTTAYTLLSDAMIEGHRAAA